MNGSEHLPEGVRIPRSAEPCDFCPPGNAINDEQDMYAERAERLSAARRISDLSDRFYALGYDTHPRHDGVLLTEDAARAVLDRLEGK